VVCVCVCSALWRVGNIARYGAHLFRPTQTRGISQRGCPTYGMKAGKMDTFQHLLPRNIDSDPTVRLNKDRFIPVKVDTLVAQPGWFLLSFCQHLNFWSRANTDSVKWRGNLCLLISPI